MRDRAEVRRELDRYRNLYRCRHLPDDLQSAPFDLGAADRGIDRNRVHVELDRSGPCVFELAGVIDPSFRGGAVKAGNDGDVERIAGAPERVEMSRYSAIVLGDFGKIAACLRL